MKLIRIIFCLILVTLINTSASAKNRYIVPYFNLSSGFEGFSLGCRYLDRYFLKKPQILDIQGSFTFKNKQQAYSIDYIRFFKNDNLRILFAYENLYRGFYGLYNDSYLSLESVYRSIGRYINISYTKNINNNYFTLGYIYDDVNLIINKDYGILSIGDFYGENGGRFNGLYFSYNRSNLDNYYNPHKGYRIYYSDKIISKYLGANYDFRMYNLNLKYYLPLGKTTLASMINWGAQKGDLPFYRMFSLGGSYSLRGYTSDRFRGKGVVNTSIEWRVPLFKPIKLFGYNLKLQGAIFFDAGKVAKSFQYLSINDWHKSYGAGFRVIADDNFVLRFDLAKSPETYSYYFVFDHAF